MVINVTDTIYGYTTIETVKARPIDFLKVRRFAKTSPISVTP